MAEGKGFAKSREIELVKGKSQKTKPYGGLPKIGTGGDEGYCVKTNKNFSGGEKLL